MEINIIRATGKTLLTFDEKLWSRIESIDFFNITIGSSGSAQVTDLEGLYLLKQLCDYLHNIQGGLYQDDIFLIADGLPKKNSERTRKDFHANYNLSIIFKNSHKVADFLGLTLDINTSSLP